MAYSIAKDGTITVNAWEQGISDSPYVLTASPYSQFVTGVPDIRNVNIISIPGEASVGFSTVASQLPSASGTLTVSTGDNSILPQGGVALATYTAITVTNSGGGLPSPLVAGTTYWVGPGVLGSENHLYTDPALNNLVTITTTGTGTQSFATTNMGQPSYGTSDYINSVLYIVDINGLAWRTVGTVPAVIWEYMGNTTLDNPAYGNGIGYYQASDGTGYLFVFRNARIDYTKTATISWVYGWNPNTGGANANSMVTAPGVNNPHASIVGQDNKFYYTDANFVGSFFEIPHVIPVPFDPTNTATFTYNQQALKLNYAEIAQCLVELSNNLLVGGIRNAIYPWDKVSTSFAFPILIGERNIHRLVTVNTNTYIFAGNRGRIYITNGTQAQLFKKIPDHLSGVIEPTYTWGDATFQKNQLYFGVSATTNSGSAINNYGGLWAIDINSSAMRITNELSYGTYAGMPTVIIPISTNVISSGSSIAVGWTSGASTYGVDMSTSNVYTGGQAYIDGDIIPVGTFLNPVTYKQVEFKLAAPLVSGESVQIQYRSDLSSSYSNLGTALNTVGSLSGFSPISGTFEKVQWVQIRMVLTGTNSGTPSYVRLREFYIRP